MAIQDIAEVSIDAEGRILLRPNAQILGATMVYRAAMGVRWIAEAGAFGPERASGMSPAQWFKQTVAAVRGELGEELRLTADTRWTNVQPEVRTEIEGSAV